MCDIAPQWRKKKESGLCEEKLLLIPLISHSVGLEDILQGLCTRTHALTHSRTHTARSKPQGFCGNLEGQNNDFHNVSLQRRRERERVSEEESEREKRESTFPFLGCRSPIVARPAGAFSPQLQLIGCPTMWGGWLRGRGSGGAIDTVKCPGCGGLRGFFFLRRGALCAPRGQSYSRSASLLLSPFLFSAFFSLSHWRDWFIFQFSCCRVFTAVQYVIFNIIGTCQLSIMRDTNTHLLKSLKMKLYESFWFFYTFNIMQRGMKDVFMWGFQQGNRQLKYIFWGSNSLYLVCGCQPQAAWFWFHF